MLEKLGSYRKDIQWISGLLCVVFLTLGFFAGGVHFFFAPETAKPAVAALFKDTLETRLAQNFDQTRVWLKSRPATEPLEIPGIPKIGLTAGEAATLDASGLADRISEGLAGRVYEGDLDSFSPEFRQSLGPLVYFRRTTYEPLMAAARGCAALAAIFGLIMVLFGRRFGRLYSLGLAISVAGMLPSLVYGFAGSALGDPAGNPQPAAGAAALTAALKPALDAGRDSVDTYLALGSILMFSAVLGRSIHWLATREKSGGEPAGPAEPEDSPGA